LAPASFFSFASTVELQYQYSTLSHARVSSVARLDLFLAPAVAAHANAGSNVRVVHQLQLETQVDNRQRTLNQVS
jgi:hypothetical protein